MKNIQTYIDNTLLKSDATPEMIEKLCKESIEYGFASVCVNPGYVPLAAKLLAGSSVKVCTVIGLRLRWPRSTAQKSWTWSSTSAA